MKRGLRSAIPGPRHAAAAFALAAALLLLNDLFVFESVLIPSSSMEPAVLPNERVFLRRFPRPTIQRWDVVVLSKPGSGGRVLKRVVALPGERVRLEDSWRVYVNGTCMAYSEQAGPLRTEAGDHPIQLIETGGRRIETRFANSELQLGPDEYFVLGDNRLASNDSRAFGPVNRSQIEGKVTRAWYSYDLRRHRLRTERLLRAVH